MYERFQDDAKRAMSQALLEAQRLGHTSIEPGHILLGLLRFPEGRAVAMLRAVGCDPDSVRSRFEALMVPGPGTGLGHLPFAPGARRALECTFEAAQSIGDRHIGTEHLLFGCAVRAERDRDAAFMTALGTDSVRLHSVLKKGLGSQRLQEAAELCALAENALAEEHRLELAKKAHASHLLLLELAREAKGEEPEP